MEAYKSKCVNSDYIKHGVKLLRFEGLHTFNFDLVFLYIIFLNKIFSISFIFMLFNKSFFFNFKNLNYFGGLQV